MRHRLTQFSQAIMEINSSLYRRTVLTCLLKWTGELFNPDSCHVFLPISHSSLFKVLTFGSPPQRPLKSFRISRNQCIAGLVFNTGKPKLTGENGHMPNGLKKHVSFPVPDSENPNTPPPVSLNAGNTLTVPLKNKSKITGVLQVANQPSSRAFNHQDLNQLKILAVHAAAALENAQKYEAQHSSNLQLQHQVKISTYQLRKANEELRQIDLLKSESLSMAAHELRLPVTVISGFSKLLIQEKPGPLNKEQSEFCGIIKKNTVYIERLIVDMLDLTKLEMGKLEMHFEAISLHDLIKEAVLSIEGGLSVGHKRIHMNIPAPDITIQGDRLRLLQVTTNLLSNAFKYSPPESHILISYDFNKTHATISVEDMGPPLTAEQLSKIFDKFYRINNASRKKIPGSGLGLAICKSIINNHNGKIWADRGPQGGNVFRFRLHRDSGPTVPPL
ncbi:GAF domain-containing sensor histidine kinase [bacterium]|nr:GAF domain-containing sensor histidine kinase [bacterium]